MSSNLDTVQLASNGAQPHQVDGQTKDEVVARDTTGPVPGATSDLRRVSLNPSHWRNARWLLGAEALVAGMLGLTGLIGVFRVAPHDRFPVAGLVLTPILSWVVLGIAAAAVAAMLYRWLALLLTGVLSASALALVVISAVGAAHHAPGPLGFTGAAILLWAVVFCYNLAVGMWLAPDHIEGPAWVPRRPKTRRAEDTDADRI